MQCSASQLAGYTKKAKKHVEGPGPASEKETDSICLLCPRVEILAVVRTQYRSKSQMFHFDLHFKLPSRH